MISIRHTLLTLTIALAANGAMAQTSFEEISADLNKSGGVYLAYPEVTTRQTPAPKGYTPFYVSHYGRHGSRYLLGDGDFTMTISLLEKAENEGCITPLGKDVLQRLRKVFTETRGRGGDLTPLGARQHKGIAERMARNYPEAFRGKRRVFARSTVVYRCAMSMAAFCDGLKGIYPQLSVDYEMTERNMSYLNYHTDESNKFTHGETGPWVEEYRKFEAEHVKPARLVNSLFSDADFIRCQVNPEKLAWAFYWIASDMQDIETKDVTFYDIFTPQELFDMWQCVNYRFYIGNANPKMSDGLVMANASTLVENILECADKAISNGDMAADLRFGHDGNVIPLLALLQIDGFDVEVRKPEEVYKHWADFKATPMASNIQIVFFRNKAGNIIVKFLHNEKECHIPAATDSWPYYKWSDVKNYYQDRLQQIKQRVANRK